MIAAKSVSLALVTLALPATLLAQSNEPKTTTKSAPGTATSSSGTMRSPVRVSGQIYVGETAPDFDLWGSRNRELRLSRTRGDWVLLTFADRRETLGEIASVQQELGALGVTVLGVCADKPQTVRAYAEKVGVPFELLSDVTGEISALYGLYDGEHRAIRPGFVVLDRQGVVRLALLGQSLPPDQVASLVRYTMKEL